MRLMQRRSDFVYNVTAYDRTRGDKFSGWCTFEQGAAMLAAAHIANAEKPLANDRAECDRHATGEEMK